ncbi:MAG: phage tail assembly chaperone [Acidimicrobiales bacterium]
MSFTFTKAQAILDLYPAAKHVRHLDDGGFLALDENDQEVSWDDAAVSAKLIQLEAAFELRKLRDERNKLLSETDYWAMSDTADMTTAQADYRQALRDITNSATSLDDVTWPTKP